MSLICPIILPKQFCSYQQISRTTLFQTSYYDIRLTNLLKKEPALSGFFFLHLEYFFLERMNTIISSLNSLCGSLDAEYLTDYTQIFQRKYVDPIFCSSLENFIFIKLIAQGTRRYVFVVLGIRCMVEAFLHLEKSYRNMQDE